MSSPLRVATKDRRNFTEEEFKRELEFHRITVGKKELASEVYRRNSSEIAGKPQTGVFRDFAQYGVHPARVVVQEILITIPFLVSSLSAKQLAAERENQEGEKDRDDILTASQLVVAPQSGEVRLSPTVDDAFKLVDKLKYANRYVLWTPALRRYMSAANFFLFRIGDSDKIPKKFLVPPRERAVVELAPLVSKNAAASEIAERSLKDPGRWGNSSPESITLTDIVNLVAELMDNVAYTTPMRELVSWYKKAFQRSKIQELLNNILINQERMISTLHITRLK